MKGKLIIFEGPDFCGKSTQIKLLKPELKVNNILYTREPGSLLPESSYFCEELRNKILTTNLSVEEEAELFAEARYEHTKEMIYYMNQGFNIICDRYIVSSFAYQAYAQDLGKQKIYDLNKATLDLLEDNNYSIFCLCFNINEDNWNQRKMSRLETENADSIESKNIHDKVYDFYMNQSIYYDYTDKLNIFTRFIDANKTPYEINKDVSQIIKTLIK